MERQPIIHLNLPEEDEILVDIMDEPVITDNPASGLGILFLKDSLEAGNSLDIPSLGKKLVYQGPKVKGESDCE